MASPVDPAENPGMPDSPDLPPLARTGTPPAHAVPDAGHRPLRVALYCRVVDNYGDAGVCWRLARQLADEHGCAIELVVDRPEVLQRLMNVPTDAPVESVTRIGDGSVHVRPWTQDHALTQRPDAIICAFGCELPAAERIRLGADLPGEKPIWINLEYLSAEPWVDQVHGMRSVKPTDRAVEHFFVPGFTPSSGGLLRERHLTTGGLDGAAVARLQRNLDLAPRPEGLRVSLFCYDRDVAAQWLAHLERGTELVEVLLPQGVASTSLAGRYGANLASGTRLRRGAMTLRVLPWLPQPEYDTLLAGCDLNMVRGEDSWIRAIWAGPPFVWQPYEQSDGTHRVKLDAFLDRLLARAPEAIAGPIRAMMCAWSGDGSIAPAWEAFARLVRDGTARAPFERLAGSLRSQPDLASKLVAFVRARQDASRHGII